MLKKKLSDETIQVIDVTTKHNILSVQLKESNTTFGIQLQELSARKKLIDELSRDYASLKESFRILKEQDVSKAWLLEWHDAEYKEIKEEQERKEKEKNPLFSV